MQNKTNPLLAELGWLVISSTLGFGMAVLLLGWSFITGVLDLHVHDTYYILPRWIALSPFFLLAIFLFYFVKEKRTSFSRVFPNWILIFSGVLLIFTLAILTKWFSEFIGLSSGGGTIYPPLSALKDPEPQPTGNSLENFITNILLVVQFTTLILLLYAVYQFGTHKKN